MCQNNALEKTRGYKKGDSITVTLSLFPAPPRVCSRRAASLLNTLSGATTRAGDAPHRRPRDDQAAAECVWADDGLLLTQICGLPLATSYSARLVPVASWGAVLCHGTDTRFKAHLPSNVRVLNDRPGL